MKFQVRDSKDRIITILKEYIYRDRFEAVEQLKSYVEIYQGFFGRNLYGSIPADNVFFRFRRDKIELPDRNEFSLFHIPFSSRHKVNNGRFNAHGVPCFYCADRLSIAWKEVKRPGNPDFATADNRFNVGIFKNADQIDYIDLSIKNLSEMYDGVVSGRVNISALTDYIALYPFILSLHTKITFGKEYVAFYAEYIMPSFLMDLLISNLGTSFFLNIKDLKSVRYSSVEDDAYFTGFNYVFPAKYVETSTEEYCPTLRNIFLRAGKFHYIYEDELQDKGWVGIRESDLPTIEGILTSGIK